MKVGILVPSVSRIGGGALYAVRGLAQAVFDPPSLSVEVFSLEDEFTREDIAEWKPLPVNTFTIIGPKALCYSPKLAPALISSGLDLAHVHGGWMYPSVASLRLSRVSRRPYLISVHGQLDSWALGRSRLKKRMAGWLYENRHLRGARCLHALSEGEARAIRAYGLRNPICVIPNGVDLPSGPRPEPPRWRRQIPEGVKILLYFGRLHPKKGMINLLKGWGLLRTVAPAQIEDWKLVIGGWSQLGYEDDLRALSKELEIEESVLFIGPQFGADKHATYSWADALILPSLSEGLPMVVLEAWSYGLPVLMTPYCNLPEGVKHGAALEIGVDPPAVQNGIRTLFGMPDVERIQMGERGRILVSREFAWSKIGSNMREVYRWCVGGGQPPASMMLT